MSVITSLMFGMFMNFAGGAAAIAVSQAETTIHKLEQRLESKLFQKACAEVVGGSATLSKLCDPSTTIRDKLKQWAKDQYAKLKSRFAEQKPSVQDDWESQSDQALGDELAAESDPTRASPEVLQALEDQLSAEGSDPAPSDPAQDAGLDANVDPGNSVDTWPSETVADVEVATSDVSEAEALGSALVDGSRVFTVSSLASNAFEFVVSKGNLLTFATVAVWQTGEWAKGDTDNWNRGPMYWLPAQDVSSSLGGTLNDALGVVKGNDTATAVSGCHALQYLSAFNSPKSQISDYLFWNLRPNTTTYAGVPDIGDYATGADGYSFSGTAWQNTDPGSRAMDKSACGYLNSGQSLADTQTAISTTFGTADRCAAIGATTAPKAVALDCGVFDTGYGFPTEKLDDGIKNLPNLGNLVSLGGFSCTNGTIDCAVSISQAEQRVHDDQQNVAQGQALMSGLLGNGTDCDHIQGNIALASGSDPKTFCARTQAGIEGSQRQAADDTAKLNTTMRWTPVGTDYSATVLEAKGTAYQTLVAELKAADGGTVAQQRQARKDFDTLMIAAGTAPHAESANVIRDMLNHAVVDCGCQFRTSTEPTGDSSTDTTVLGVDGADASVVDNTTQSMMMALTDICGHFDYAYTADGKERQNVAAGPSPEGNVGVSCLLPSQLARGLLMAGVTSDVSPSADNQYLAAGELMAYYLQQTNGNMVGAFDLFVRDNKLAPVDGAWASQASSGPLASGDDWRSTATVGGDTNDNGGRQVNVPTGTLLAEAASQYKMVLDHPEFDIPPPNNAGGFQLHGQPSPPASIREAFDAAAKVYDVPVALLYAVAAQESGFTPDACSGDTNRDGAPNSYGMFQMQPGTFRSNAQAAGLPSDAFIATKNTGICPNWGEPKGELDPALQVRAAAYMLHGQGATSSATEQQLEAAVYHYNHGPDAPMPANLMSDQYVASVMGGRYPAYQSWVNAGEGGAPGVTYTGPIPPGYTCCEQLQSDAALFSWNPAGGYPDSFPYGQCTYYADQWNPVIATHGITGNAKEWIASAHAHGVATSSTPTVGAAVVWDGAGPYEADTGHVGLVVAIDTNGAGYWISEMNYAGLGKVDTRHVQLPDPYALGYIPS